MLWNFSQANLSKFSVSYSNVVPALCFVKKKKNPFIITFIRVKFIITVVL